MSKILKIIMNIIFVLCILLLVGYFILRIMGILTIYKVETGSMEDGIHAGDYILIVSKKEYHKGDVVTYKKDEFFITHRIVKIDYDTVITKGDANNTEDEAIDVDDIVGKVVYNGGVLNFLIDFKFIIAGVLVALYLVSCYFGDNKKNKKMMEE